MAEKIKEKTIELEREYVIPLRKETLKLPRYRRAGRAMKTIKVFIAKHMKVEERDVKKVKIDSFLNQEVLFRGRKNPPHKIKVKARKQDGIVYVELAEMPAVLKFKKDREAKKHKKSEPKPKNLMEKVAASTENKEKTDEEKKEEKEKSQSVVEASQKTAEKDQKAQKHLSKDGIKPQAQHRTALSRH